MTRADKLKQFFEQLRGKGNPNAQTIRNAAAATGNIAEIIPEILSYAEGMGVDAAAELADLTVAKEEAWQAEALRETAASLTEKSGALAAEADPEKRQELIESIRQDIASLEPSNNTRQSFRLVRLDSIEVKPPAWIVKNFIEQDSFCCLYGDSGAGKSFLAIELAACVATGTPFYGLPVKQGPVIYIAGEGHSGLARRFKAWGIARGIPQKGAPLYISEGAVSLIEPVTMAAVCNALEKQIRENGRPSLVILDTWSRVLGGDDSAPSDAAAGVAALDGLRARFGKFAALVVHHSGHGDKKRGRGWSGLRAAVDMEYRAERGTDEILRLECTKAKDTSGLQPMAFQFMTVELPWRTENGEPMTSAVLDRMEWGPAPKAGKEPAIAKNPAIVLDILKDLIADGKPATLRTWGAICKQAGVIKQRFYEARKELEKKGIIECHTDPRTRSVTVTVRGLLYSPPLPDVTVYNGQSNEMLPNVTAVTSVTEAPELFQGEEGRGRQ